MPTINYFSNVPSCQSIYEQKGESYLDQETGCNKCSDNYEQCRQSFYLKQQVEINKTSNTDSKCDFTTYQQQIDNLSSANTRLLTEKDLLQSQVSQLNSQCYSQTTGSSNLELTTYQTLIILLGAAVLILSYIILKKKIRQK